MESKNPPEESEQVSAKDIAGFIAEWDLSEGDLTDQ